MQDTSTQKIQIISNVKASISVGKDMIAIANGQSTIRYGKILMSNTSPYAVDSTNSKMKSDSTSMGDF
jgi:hypothetical protein